MSDKHKRVMQELRAIQSGQTTRMPLGSQRQHESRDVASGFEDLVAEFAAFLSEQIDLFEKETGNKVELGRKGRDTPKEAHGSHEYAAWWNVELEREPYRDGRDDELRAQLGKFFARVRDGFQAKHMRREEGIYVFVTGKWSATAARTLAHTSVIDARASFDLKYVVKEKSSGSAESRRRTENDEKRGWDKLGAQARADVAKAALGNGFRSKDRWDDLSSDEQKKVTAHMAKREDVGDDVIQPISPEGGVGQGVGGEADAGNEPSIVEVPENVAASMSACCDVVLSLMPDIEVMRNGIEAHLAGDLDSPTAQMAGQAFEQAQALHSTMQTMMASVGLTPGEKAESRRRRSRTEDDDSHVMKVGSRVKINSPGDADHGKLGKIEKMSPDEEFATVRIDGGPRLQFDAADLQLNPTEATEASDTTAVARSNWNAMPLKDRAWILNDLGANEEDLDGMARMNFDKMMSSAKDLYDPSFVKSLQRALQTGAESRGRRTESDSTWADYPADFRADMMKRHFDDGVAAKIAAASDAEQAAEIANKATGRKQSPTWDDRLTAQDMMKRLSPRFRDPVDGAPDHSKPEPTVDRRQVRQDDPEAWESRQPKTLGSRLMEALKGR
jgi:hypothetical protein